MKEFTTHRVSLKRKQNQEEQWEQNGNARNMTKKKLLNMAVILNSL